MLLLHTVSELAAGLTVSGGLATEIVTWLAAVQPLPSVTVSVKTVVDSNSTVDGLITE